MKKLTPAQVSDLKVFEDAAVAAGMAKVAENNSAVNAVETPAAAKRGRKPSNRLTFPKFAAAVKSGEMLPGMITTEEKREGSRVVAFAGVRAENPVISLDEEGNLTLSELTTDNATWKRTPIEKVIRTISAVDVMALFNKAE